MKKGYIEWVSPESRIGFISNCFNKVVYINQNWPDGTWEDSKELNINMEIVKERCMKGRSFNKEELMLELL
ncbi:MAG: hypothetical protein GY861_29290 [bacterium]|nr:hypothetical protein [bacterium]